jgi:choline/glycine/proline betaine transport protein
MVSVLMLIGVLGWYPSNSLEILKPVNSSILWFAVACVVFCFINLFNKERVPGEKEFDNNSYVSLLVTCGMGVGIMVYGFNEAPALSQYNTVRNPLGLVLNHWIVIPWCMYCTFAIFEIYNEKYKLLPDWLNTVKTFLYGVMMMLGIAISFALGVNTISDSALHIYGIEIPSYSLVILLGALVTISLMRGMHKGMKVFAKISMYLLYFFMLVLIILAPKDTLQSICSGVSSFFSDFAYNNYYRGDAVQNDWTSYYWIWWMGWIAFTSPFIARISKGRSIRSMVFYSVIVPSILIAAYMLLGNSIGMELMTAENIPVSEIPFVAINKHWIIPVVFLVLMSMFYITSSDSQSFMMDQMISKGSATPIKYRKIGWVFLEVLFVTILLLAGNSTISAIQGVSFLVAPAFIVFGLIYLYYFIKHYVSRNKINKSNLLQNN